MLKKRNSLTCEEYPLDVYFIEAIDPTKKSCWCGCGEELPQRYTSGRKKISSIRFINGHQNRGRKASKETKMLMSTVVRERYTEKEKHPRFGKRWSEDWKQKYRYGNKNPMYGVRGKLHPMFGRHHTEETKRKIRQNRGPVIISNKQRLDQSRRMKGHIVSEHTRLKISMSNSWNDNGMWTEKPTMRTSNSRARKILIALGRLSNCGVNSNGCTKALHAHHIDKNPFNNDPNNLMCLCAFHHKLADTHMFGESEESIISRLKRIRIVVTRDGRKYTEFNKGFVKKLKYSVLCSY